MGIVLSEAAYTHQTVQGAAELVAVYNTQLTHADRQVTVGVGLALVHQNTAGAVHRLDAVVLIVDDGGVHIVLVVVPVAGVLPQAAGHDLGGAHFHIAGLLMQAAPELLQLIADDHAVGQEGREARALIEDVKELQLLAQLAVVTLFGLLQHRQVGVQLALLGEGYAVDAAEHLVLGIAAPVGAGGLGQLDRLDPAGVRQMGAGAEVGELALLVEGHLGAALGVLGDELQLVGLLSHELLGLGLVQLKALDGVGLLDDLVHLGLELGQLLRAEGRLDIDVVVEAVINGRADGQLGLGVEALDRLGQDMGGGVVEGLLAVRVLKGQDLQGAVGVQNGAQVADLAVYPGGTGGLVEAGAELLGDIHHGYACFKLLDGAIFQCDMDHDASLL